MKQTETPAHMLWKLFKATFLLSAFTFGGGFVIVSLMKKKFVEELHWLEEDEMLDITAIAQSSPGPISINSATFVGMRLGGIPGVLLCTLGCILPSFFICLTLAFFYYKYRDFSGVQVVLAALRPAVVALIASAGLSILLLGLFQSDLSGVALANFRPIEAVLFVGALVVLRRFKLSAISIIFGTGVVGTVAYFALGLA